MKNPIVELAEDEMRSYRRVSKCTVRALLRHIETLEAEVTRQKELHANNVLRFQGVISDKDAVRRECDLVKRRDDYGLAR